MSHLLLLLSLLLAFKLYDDEDDDDDVCKISKLSRAGTEQNEARSRRVEHTLNHSHKHYGHAILPQTTLDEMII